MNGNLGDNINQREDREKWREFKMAAKTLRELLNSRRRR